MSRQFVCVRLDSYENEQTMATVRELMDGELLNTAFAVFAPDGKTKLTPKARGLASAFGRRSVAEGLRRIAKEFPGRNLDDPAHTPDFTSVRESVNIAACDERPLVLAWGRSAAECRALERELRALAWTPEFVGRVHWDFAVGEGFREYVSDAPEGDRGVIIVQPEPFGRGGSVIAGLDPDEPIETQRGVVREALEQFAKSFEKLPYKDHVQRGKNIGVKWQEAIRMHDRPMDDERRRRNK